MIKKQILEKLFLELPEKASDLKEAILLLVDIIDETSQSLVKVSSKKLQDKEYQKSIQVIELIKELDNAREGIVEQVADIDIEETEIKDSSEPKVGATSNSESEIRDKVDYSLYSVDNEVAHDLYESYTFKRPYAFVWQGEKLYATNFKAILLHVANTLLNIHGDEFRQLTNNEIFIGRKNRMLSPNPAELLDPKLLDDNKTYIFSCLSSDAIIRFIRKLLEYFNYDVEEFKIYLRADYNDLHKE